MSGEAREYTRELSAMASANITQSRVAQHVSPGVSRIRTCGCTRELPRRTHAQDGTRGTHRAHDGACGCENPVRAGHELALRHHRVREQRAERDHYEKRGTANPVVRPVRPGDDLRSAACPRLAWRLQCTCAAGKAGSRRRRSPRHDAWSRRLGERKRSGAVEPAAPRSDRARGRTRYSKLDRATMRLNVMTSGCSPAPRAAARRAPPQSLPPWSPLAWSRVEPLRPRKGSTHQRRSWRCAAAGACCSRCARDAPSTGAAQTARAPAPLAAAVKPQREHRQRWRAHPAAPLSAGAVAASSRRQEQGRARFCDEGTACVAPGRPVARLSISSRASLCRIASPMSQRRVA